MGAVSNPLKSDLDCGTNAVKNASAVTADTVSANVGLYAGTFAPGGAHGTLQLHAGDGDGITIYPTKDDPTVNPPNAPVVLRRIDAQHVELWVNTVENGWVRAA